MTSVGAGTRAQVPRAVGAGDDRHRLAGRARRVVVARERLLGHAADLVRVEVRRRRSGGTSARPCRSLRPGRADQRLGSLRSSDGLDPPCLRSPVFDMIDVRLATLPGWWIASAWAIIPPIDTPTTWARVDAEVVEQPGGVVGHVADRVRRLGEASRETAAAISPAPGRGGPPAIFDDRPMSRLSKRITRNPWSTSRSTQSSGQATSWPPSPITSSSGSPSPYVLVLDGDAVDALPRSCRTLGREPSSTTVATARWPSGAVPSGRPRCPPRSTACKTEIGRPRRDGAPLRRASEAGRPDDLAARPAGTGSTALRSAQSTRWPSSSPPSTPASRRCRPSWPTSSPSSATTSTPSAAGRRDGRRRGARRRAARRPGAPGQRAGPLPDRLPRGPRPPRRAARAGPSEIARRRV